MRSMIALIALLFAAPAWAVPTALTVQSVAEAAAALNLQDADQANGNEFDNQQEDVLLIVRNTDGSNSATVTITAQKTSIDIPGYGTVSKSNQAISLAAGDMKVLGPFPKEVFNDSTNRVEFTISGTGAASVYAVPFRSSKLMKVR